MFFRRTQPAVGKLYRVRNTERANTANDEYFAVPVENGDGYEWLFLTEHDLQRARSRAAINQEDVSRIPERKVSTTLTHSVVLFVLGGLSTLVALPLLTPVLLAGAACLFVSFLVSGK